jgi:hypothetical protein
VGNFIRGAVSKVKEGFAETDGAGVAEGVAEGADVGTAVAEGVAEGTTLGAKVSSIDLR